MFSHPKKQGSQSLDESKLLELATTFKNFKLPVKTLEETQRYSALSKNLIDAHIKASQLRLDVNDYPAALAHAKMALSVFDQLKKNTPADAPSSIYYTVLVMQMQAMDNRMDAAEIAKHIIQKGKKEGALEEDINTASAFLRAFSSKDPLLGYSAKNFSKGI